ncbi:MAG: thioredoxin-disulfide reductase [Armatimonadetes bacterium]|nr:thioredoxin-disulfide reductase [Armatimonadota bacterium]
MPETKSYDVVIVGGGVAGLTAALYAGRARLSAVVLEKMAAGGQAVITELIENYPGIKTVTGHDLSQVMEDQAKSFGAEIVFEEISEIRVENRKKIAIGSEALYEGKAMILATGGEPRKLGIPGETEYRGRGVSYCAVCDGAFFRDKRISVVGGGDSALQESLYLARMVEKLTLVHRRDQFRGSKILQDRVLSNARISIVWNSVVEEVVGNHKLQGLQLTNRQTGAKDFMETDGLFIYVGFEPNSGFLQGLVDTTADGYIITDEKMQTSMPGIYAAGDVRKCPIRQLVTAASDGAVAAVTAEKYIEEQAHFSFQPSAFSSQPKNLL